MTEALRYESCGNDEKLIDFYPYQPDDHRLSYFYYFLRRGLVLREYEGIYSQNFLDLVVQGLQSLLAVLR